MAEESIPFETDDITDDDRLWAALAWIPIWPIWPIIPIVLLLIEGKKDRPFIRYHAILSLLTGIVGTILSVICLGIIVLLAMFYFAIKAYQGEYTEVPGLTKFARDQGWV